MKDILTLGIESSCDETSVAVVKNGREVLSNVIDTQISIHEKFGGVVPEIASRNHVENISPVMKEALKEASSRCFFSLCKYAIIHQYVRVQKYAHFYRRTTHGKT